MSLGPLYPVFTLLVCDRCHKKPIETLSGAKMYGYVCGECNTRYNLCIKCIKVNSECIKCNRDKLIDECLNT